MTDIEILPRGISNNMKLESPHLMLLKMLSQKRARPEVTAHYAGPIDELEASIAKIWADVLRIEDVGRNDNIFELGGDSLHMTQIASRMWKYLGVEIPIELLFQHLTVGELATAVREIKNA
jgi:acyl carrier protein